jgi:hypothetical protein
MKTEANKAKPESATTDCSADGSAAPTPTKPGVQADGKLLLEDYAARIVKRLSEAKAMVANGDELEQIVVDICSSILRDIDDFTEERRRSAGCTEPPSA